MGLAKCSIWLYGDSEPFTVLGTLDEIDDEIEAAERDLRRARFVCDETSGHGRLRLDPDSISAWAEDVPDPEEEEEIPGTPGGGEQPASARVRRT